MAPEHADSRDERIGRILNDYLDSKLQGKPVSEEELIAANPDLAEELRAHFGTVRQMSHVSSQGGAAGDPIAAPPHDALPGYEILGEIHRGGQGVVYQALQKATKRKVAIKVMREGPFGSWRDRARFDREVQILAGLKHPRIVTIHDSGTAAGCHFVVMDYIEGLPLDAWLTSRARPLDELLRLFVTICDAVNAAHIKGIIHRDLKPGNIRISDEGAPHILDFGLAKDTAQGDEDDKSRDMTRVGQFVGSLPWSSPEQAQGLLDQIDTRTDVYALGVILYQMLTNAFPYEVVGPMRDVLNRIVTSEPVRPTMIRNDLSRDLEAIVLKCLRKDAHGRYQTAGELGRDVERYLNGEPIAARSDSGLYMLRKMLHRYRVPVAVATAFAILVGLSLLASVSLWRRAVAERDRAVVAQIEQDRQRARADAKAAEAEQARGVAEQERAIAQERAEKLRQATYLNQIALARNAYEQKYLTQVRQVLDGCPADLRGWEWYYLSRMSRQTTLLDVAADRECVVALAIGSDGKRVVTGGSDGVIKVWDAATGEAAGQLKGHSGQVRSLALSPDGRWIASGGRDRTLRLWDARDGTHRVLQRAKESINCLAFSPDGKTLVSGGQGKVLTFWEVSQARPVGAAPAQSGEISCVAYSPDGKHVVSGELLGPTGGAGRIRVWDAEATKGLKELTGPPGAVLCVAYSRNGERIAAGGGIAPAGLDARGTLKVFDADTGEELLSLRGHDGFVDAVAFSPDGRLLASAGVPSTPAFGMESDRTLKIWDAASGEELCTYSAHKGGGRCTAWSPDAGRVFSGGMDGRLKAWPSAPPVEARVLSGHSGPVLRLAYSPDGKRLASAGGQAASFQAAGEPADNSARLWDAATGTRQQLLTGHTGAIYGLAWSSDGRYLATGGADQTICIWDSHTGERLQRITNPDGTVQSVAFSPDGTLVAAVAGNTATLWALPDGKRKSQLFHSEAPRSIAFSADGPWLATGSPGGEIRIWNSRSGNDSRTIAADPGLNGAWFSPDSSMIASAHANGTIVLWDAATGAKLAVMRGPERSVDWLSFSPDGRRVAACTADMILQVWEVSAASLVFTTRAHNAPITCVQFSPDGSAIATSAQDTLIKIWDASPAPAPDARVAPTSAPK